MWLAARYCLSGNRWPKRLPQTRPTEFYSRNLKHFFRHFHALSYQMTLLRVHHPAQRSYREASVYPVPERQSHDSVDAKRFLYSRGGIRGFLKKAERICSSSLKPQSSAIVATRSRVSSSQRRAASIRIASTDFAGVRPRI